MRTLFLAVAFAACATTEEATNTEVDNFETVEQTEDGFINTTNGEDFTVNTVENDPNATEKALKAVDEVVEEEEFPDSQEDETSE